MNVESILPKLTILSQNGDPSIAEVFVAQTRAGDATRLIEFVDGLDPRHSRETKWIVNLSTQYGCPVGCAFCDAAHRYFGDLTADELLAQVAAVLARHPQAAARCEKLKIHFARMGEPALNDAVLDALCRLPGLVKTPGLWACLATTAPAGREAWFERLLMIKNECYLGRCQLQFSLNTSDEAQRRSLTPIRLLPFSWINAYAARFHGRKDRKVTLNFALARGFALDPQRIAQRFDPAHVALKLTPLNPTHTGRKHALDTLSEDEIGERAAALGECGFEVLISSGDTRENAIGSNCGQSVRRLREEGGIS